MAVIGPVLFCIVANVIVAQGILLENINNHQQTTPVAHPDTLVLLMQEVIQMKNTLQQNSQEINHLQEKSKEINHLKSELEALRNTSYSSEINKLHAEISVLKFTFENAINDQSSSHSVNDANFTGVMSKLRTVENGIRQLTLALNEKVSKVEMNAIKQQHASLSTSVTQITNHDVQVDTLLKNITSQKYDQKIASLSASVSQISNHEANVDTTLKNITDRVHALEYDKVIPGRIRLVNGSTIWMGRVEVSYNGTWATVPGYTRFDDREAQVVCRMLGYPTKNAAAIHKSSPLYFGKGTGHVNMDLYGLDCTGSERSLFDCNRSTYSNLRQAHEYDAGVACMDIRLAGGSSPMNGRVEINLGEGWGTVCDDDWGYNEARVVCKMLGYTGSAQALQGTVTTGGNGTIWLDDLQCTGSETSLVQCKRTHFDIGFAGCSHREDARVVCHA